MELRQLRYFVAVADELSFSRAAPRVFASQSTLSAAISALEDDVGARLLERSTRKVRLTAAGEAFLTEARAVLHAAARAQTVAAEASQGLRGTLRVGTLTSITTLDLPSLIGAFRMKYPLVEVHVHVSGSGSTGIAEGLRKGRLDVGVLALQGEDARGLELRPMASVPYVAVIPRSHRLAARASVSLQDLVSERFVDGVRGFGSRIALDRQFARLGHARKILVEVSDALSVVPYVKAISGAAVIPRFGAAINDPDVVAIPVKDFGEMFVLSLATRADTPVSPMVACLLEASRGFIHDRGQY